MAMPRQAPSVDTHMNGWGQPVTDDTMSVDTSGVESIADLVRSTLGPFGANKVVVQADGSVSITASAAVVLESIRFEDPFMAMLGDAAASFDDAHGDGVASFVALTGALLRCADGLVETGLHPTAIERGFRRGLDVAIEDLDRRAVGLGSVGIEAVAASALTATRDPGTRERVSGYVGEITERLRAVDEPLDPRRHVKVVSRLGGALSQTDLIEGVVVDKKPVTASMPRRVEDTRVALVSETIDLPKFAGTFAKRDSMRLSAAVEGFDDRAAIQAYERETFDDWVGELTGAGCRFVATARSVNDRVKNDLANSGVLAVHRVDDADFRRIARVTGATATADLDRLDPDDLGRADVTVERFAGRDMTVIRSLGGEPRGWTLFCRAPDAQSAETFDRSVEGALAAAGSAVRSGGVVPGGGAVEAGVAATLRERSRRVTGRDQLAMAAVGEALTTIPRTLATNAGLDGATALTRLRSAHADGRDRVGIDSLGGAVGDVFEAGPVVEPVGLKREVWQAAVDLAVRIVRIDEELAATELEPDDDELPPEP